MKPEGARAWQQAYRFAGKQKKLTHGPYPLLSLADARRLRDEAKRLLASGVDPGANKQADTAAIAASVAAAASTFGALRRSARRACRTDDQAPRRHRAPEAAWRAYGGHLSLDEGTGDDGRRPEAAGPAGASPRRTPRRHMARD
ncbi:Arm DNA-binding domain-containing protein [Ancylobacter tetraedralis]|uniref:Arm DNA-binding domain-containing protein n=1 Tax=Ancylobacter tetraedralis TaxID=217068 RepID=UPI0031B63F3F